MADGKTHLVYELHLTNFSARRRQPDFIDEGAWHPALNLRIFELTRQNQSGVNRSAKYATAIVVAHLLVNIMHGLAHRELDVGLARLDSIFVIVVVLIFPLIAMALLWTSAKRLGAVLLSLSMFGSLLFGLYHHFLAVSPDHVHSQPASAWGTTFVITAYLLLMTEAIGTYVGVHFLWIAEESSNRAVKVRFR